MKINMGEGSVQPSGMDGSMRSIFMFERVITPRKPTSIVVKISVSGGSTLPCQVLWPDGQATGVDFRNVRVVSGIGRGALLLINLT